MLNVERDDALGNFDAVGLAGEIRAGRISPQEAADAATARAEAVNPQINAIVEMIADPVCGDGAFAGVPSFIKDNEDIAGLATRHGSRATPAVPLSVTSPFVKDFQALGFNALGKTTMPEFGLTASTETLAYGATRNPRNLSHSVGGSSGGSAALVAAGVVPLAQANDGGGSIRIPAACCGLIGLKPSRDRFSGRPEMDQLPVRIGAEGVVTRTVRDTATFFYEMGKIRKELPPIGLVEGPSHRRLRFGLFVGGMSGIPVEDETAEAVLEAGRTLEGLGHRVDVIPFPFDEQFGYDFVRYWAALSFTIKHGGKKAYGPTFNKDLIEPIGQQLASMLPGFALKMPTTIRRLRKFADEYERAFTNFDVLVSPVTAHPAPEIGYLSPDIDGYTHLVRLIRFASYTAIQNVSGAPAISLPLAVTSNGVPIGVQFAGPFGSEERLLDVAFELEESVGWK